MRPTLRQLEYLVAVADRLNFREAAESCLVTQPALSSQLQQLEELLSLRLFERDKKRVLPTVAGRALAQRARELLQRTDEFVDLASTFTAPLAGTLRLGVIPTIGPYFLPKVLGAVTERWPLLELYLREDQTERILARLVSGDLDVCLLALDVDLVSGVETLPLFSDPFVFACSDTHALASSESIKISDLSGESVLLLEEGHCLRDQTQPLCRAAGSNERADFRASSLSTLVQMVASGLGVTLLPEVAIGVESRVAERLRTIPFDAEGPSRSVGLAWRKSSPRGEEFHALGQSLLEAYLAS